MASEVDRRGFRSRLTTLLSDSHSGTADAARRAATKRWLAYFGNAKLSVETDGR